jgi:hypothetical protein
MHNVVGGYHVRVTPQPSRDASRAQGAFPLRRGLRPPAHADPLERDRLIQASADEQLPQHRSPTLCQLP